MTITSDYGDTRFRSFFTAVRYALEGDSQRARQLFGDLYSSSGDRLAGYLASHLDDSNHASIRAIFDDPAVYEAVTSLPHFSAMRTAFADITSRFIRGTYKKAQHVYLLDIGVGDGKQLSDTIRRLPSEMFLHTAILDPSKKLLSIASQGIKNARGGANIDVKTIAAGIENISTDQLLSIFGRPFDILIASNSIHHIPYEGKLAVLAMLGSLAAYFFLHEIDADHDRPERGDRALVYSVWSLYNETLRITMDSDLPPEIKDMALKCFFGPEARNILMKPRCERGDYHTPAKIWQDLVAAACPTCKRISYGPTFVSGPITMIQQGYQFQPASISPTLLK